MPTLRFTQNLQRHIACPSAAVAGTTVREALEAYFAARAGVRGYVLDEQGELRRHMLLFVDGRPIRDRRQQSDPVGEASTIDVMQALSGG